MYLSAANKAAGSARSQIMAEAGRQRTRATKDATNQIVDFWFGGLGATPPRKRKSRTKR